MAENAIVESDLVNSDEDSSSDLEQIPKNIAEGVRSSAMKAAGYKKTRNDGGYMSSLEPVPTISEFDPTRNPNKGESQELYGTTTEDAASLVTSQIEKTSEPSLKKVEGYLVRKLTTVSMANPGQFVAYKNTSGTDSEIRVHDETHSFDGRRRPYGGPDIVVDRASSLPR